MCRLRTASATIAQLMVAVLYLCIVIQKALKITFLVGEKYFSSWKMKKASGGKTGLLVLTI